MPDDARLRLLAKVARLHYLHPRKNNTEIGHILEVSGTEVGRLLKEADDKGLVRIEIVAPRLEELQTRLIAKYPSLRDAVVVATDDVYSSQTRAVAAAAGRYFDFLVENKPGQKFGISGGDTMFQMVESIKPKPRDLSLYPTALIARGPLLPDHMDTMPILALLAQKCKLSHSKAHYVTVPPYENGNDPDLAFATQDRLFGMFSKIKDVFEQMHHVDVVIAGVGQIKVPAEYLSKRGRSILDPLQEIGVTSDWLSKHNVVGDLSYSLFDHAGNQQPSRRNFFLTPGVTHLRKMTKEGKTVVLIGTKYKVDAIAAALRGGLCNVLITADSVADELLNIKGT